MKGKKSGCFTQRVTGHEIICQKEEGAASITEFKSWPEYPFEDLQHILARQGMDSMGL